MLEKRCKCAKNYLVLNPDTIWTKKHSIEIIKMKNLFFSKKASNMLLVVKKKRSFDERLGGDFSMKKNILTYSSKKEYIFTGCQIINRDLFINIKKKGNVGKFKRLRIMY